MTRKGNTTKDQGHLSRKAAHYTLAVLLFVPHVMFYAAAKLDEKIIELGGNSYRWSHPCLYAARQSRKG